MQEILEKLKREWKTFTIAVITTVAGAWQTAVAMGADIQDLFAWVPEAYKTSVLFAVGFLMLILRKYTPAEPDVDNQ